MSGNAGSINEVISPVANKQVTDLEALLKSLEIQFVSTAKQADTLIKATGGATSFSSFTKGANESTKATEKLIAVQEKRRQVVKLSTAEEFDAYLKGKTGILGMVESTNKLDRAQAKASDGATARSGKAIENSIRQAKEYTRAQGIIERLTTKLKFYKQEQVRATDPADITKYTKLIQGTELQIKQLGNAGRDGFDSLGNAVKKSGNAFQAIGQKVVTLARLLPGIGVVGLIAFATEPIIEYISQLDVFKKKAEEVISDTAIDGSEFKNALGAVNSLKTSIDEFNTGTITGKELVDRYNESIGQTAGILTTTSEVEAFYNSKAKAYVEAMYLRAKANAALEASADKLAEAQKRAINDPTFGDKFQSFVVNINKLFNPLATSKFDIGKDALFFQGKAVDELNKKAKDGFVLFDKLKKESDEFNKANGFGNLDGAKREQDRQKQLVEAKRKAKELADARAKAEEEAYKLQIENEKLALDARTRLLDDYFENEKKIRKESEDDVADSNNARLLSIDKYTSMELDVITQLYQNKLITEKEFQERRKDIEEQAALQSIDSAIQLSEELINIQKAAGENTQSEEDKLAKLKIARSKLVRDAIIDDLKTEEQKRKELNDRIKEFSDEAKELLITVVNAGVTNRKNALQKEADTIEKNKQLEIEAVEKSLLTEQQKADKVAVIEAKAQADKEIIAQRQRQLDIEQAKFNKAIAIAEIIQNTAIAVTKVTAQAGLLGLLTGVPAVIALGAIQIATVLAQPIPAFKDGGTMQRTGVAKFGERGTELRIDPDGTQSLTPGTETLGVVKAGTKFISNRDLMQIIAKPEPKFVGGQLDERLLDEMRKQTHIISKSKPVHGTILTSKGVKGYVGNTTKWNNYLKRNGVN